MRVRRELAGGPERRESLGRWRRGYRRGGGRRFGHGGVADRAASLAVRQVRNEPNHLILLAAATRAGRRLLIAARQRPISL